MTQVIGQRDGAVGSVTVTHPGREPFVIWDQDQALTLALALCEAVHRAWPDPYIVEGP